MEVCPPSGLRAALPSLCQNNPGFALGLYVAGYTQVYVAGSELLNGKYVAKLWAAIIKRPHCSRLPSAAAIPVRNHRCAGNRRQQFYLWWWVRQWWKSVCKILEEREPGNGGWPGQLCHGHLRGEKIISVQQSIISYEQSGSLKKKCHSANVCAAAGIGLFPFAASAENVHTMQEEKLVPFYIPRRHRYSLVRRDGHPPLSAAHKPISSFRVLVCGGCKKMGPAPHYHKAGWTDVCAGRAMATVMVEDVFYEIPQAAGICGQGDWCIHFSIIQINPFVPSICTSTRILKTTWKKCFIISFPICSSKTHAKDPGIAKTHARPAWKIRHGGVPGKRQAIIDKYGLTA